MIKKVFLTILSICSTLLIINHTDAVCISVPKANIRMGPGTNYEKAWQVYRYMPFKKVGASIDGLWYAIEDVDGDVNWVSKSLVTNSYDCAVVKKEQVNIRTGPGTRYQKSSMSPALRYDAFKVLKRQASWVRVQDASGSIGWIHRDYLWIY